MAEDEAGQEGTDADNPTTEIAAGMVDQVGRAIVKADGTKSHLAIAS